MSNDSEDEAADEEAVADAGEEGENADQAGFEEGAFVELDYTARTVEGGDLVDTTDPEVAEAEDVDADREFAPRTVVLGEGHIFPTVEKDIVDKQHGDAGSVVVPADEAFGEYDDDQVRTVSKDKLPEDDRYPGAQVRIDGQEGFIETIIGGRARVDFNHPLAGEDIQYEYEVVGEITDPTAKAESLLETTLDLQLDVRFETDVVEEKQLVETDVAEEQPEYETDVAEEQPEYETDVAEEQPEYETVEVERESLYIEATSELMMDQQWMFQKQELSQQFIDLLGVDQVVVEEVLEGTGGLGMPGMMGGGLGGGGEDIEAALEEADIDADELVEELEEP